MRFRRSTASPMPGERSAVVVARGHGQVEVGESPEELVAEAGVGALGEGGVLVEVATVEVHLVGDRERRGELSNELAAALGAGSIRSPG